MKTKLKFLIQALNSTENNVALLVRQISSTAEQIRSLPASALSFCDWDELFTIANGCLASGVILGKMVSIIESESQRKHFLRRLQEIPSEFWPESIKDMAEYQPSEMLGSFIV